MRQSNIERIKRMALLLPLLLPAISNNTFGQITSKFGYELGLITSTSQELQVRIGHIRSYKSPPLISLLGGFKWQIIINNRFEFLTGIQYGMIGARFHDTDIEQKGDEYIKKITYHKFCIPLTVGFLFPNKNKPLSLFTYYVGFRPNFIWNGKEYIKWEGPGNYIIWEHANYPLSHLGGGFIPAKWFNSQIQFGISKDLGQKFKLNLSYYLGMKIEFSEPGYFDSHSNTYSDYMKTSLRNNEFALSLTYLLNSKKEKSEN